MWGVDLVHSSPPHFSTLLVLQKYLRSDKDDVDLAAQKLEDSLKWRKEFGVDEEGYKEKYAKGEAFEGLGYVTKVRSMEQKEQVCVNVRPPSDVELAE